MKKKIKIERITCICEEVIAGCVHGEQDVRWDTYKAEHLRRGCTVDVVNVGSFKFGECQCEDQKTKKYFKILAKNE